jgi:16S rRNA (guanine1207-N2)-methyltransferase
MSDHYFTSDPKSASRRASAMWAWAGKEYEFITDAGVFCRGHVDFGSRLLIDSVPELHGRVLDLGCGYGFVGIAAKLKHPAIEAVLCDINERAVALARENAGRLGAQVTALPSDGFAAVEGRFDFILCNPPVRAGKAVYYPWFEEASRRLNAGSHGRAGATGSDQPGGALVIVLQKKQGAPSARRRLEELYPRVTELGREGGYHVLAAWAAEG